MIKRVKKALSDGHSIFEVFENCETESDLIDALKEGQQECAFHEFQWWIWSNDREHWDSIYPYENKKENYSKAYILGLIESELKSHGY